MPDDAAPASTDLHDLSIARMEGLKPAEIREVLLLTRENHPHLLTAWHEFEGRKS